MRIFPNIFPAFFLLLSLCLSVIAGKPIDVLLCAYDTGDSNMMSRLLPQLKKEKMTYVVAAFGRGADIFKDEKNLYKIKGGSLEDRAQMLPTREIESLQAELDPRVVLAGMASVGQAQMLNAFPKAKRVAIYDNFDAPAGKEFIQPFLKTIGRVHLYMIPAEFLVPDFETLCKGALVEAVGQPALEEWQEVFEKTDRARLRKDLKLETSQKVIVFAGGMDDTYKHNLELFVRTVARHPHWKVFITYHPKTNGTLERGIVAGEKANNITVSNDIKTNVLATIADVLVCHKSSVCQQAFSVGVPCVYVAGRDYHNFLIGKGLVPRLETEDEIEEHLTKIMTEKAKPWTTRLEENQQVMRETGIPPHASRVIVGRLKKLIGE
jgi:hypothetical protein